MPETKAIKEDYWVIESIKNDKFEESYDIDSEISRYGNQKSLKLNFKIISIKKIL